MMYWYTHDMGWWGHAGPAVLMTVFLILVLGGTAVLVKFLLANETPPKGEVPPEASDPADILAARFARGEIGENDYRDRLAVLHEHGRR